MKTLWLRKAPMSAQMANETNLCVEESMAVRTRNGSGSGWCGSAFSKLLHFFWFHWLLTTSCHLSLFCVRYSRQLGAILKDFIETFSVFLKCFFLASLGALALRQFAIEQFLWKAVIFHADNMTGLTKLWLHQDGIAARKRSPSKNFGVWDVFLPCDAENFPQTGCVKVVSLLYMLLISCPHFTAIKEDGKNNSSVYLDFGYLSDSTHSSRVNQRLHQLLRVWCSPPITQDLEKFTYLSSTLSMTLSRWPLMVMLGSTYGFSGWCITSVFFVLIVRSKLSQDIENLSMLFCMLALVVAFSAQSLASRNSLTVSVFTLVFAWSLLRLKTEPLVQYQMSIPLSKPPNALKSITESMIM